MHGVMMPLAMFEEIMGRWEDGLERDLGAGAARGIGAPQRAGARRTARGVLASITTPSIPNMGIGTGDSAIGGGGGA